MKTVYLMTIPFLALTVGAHMLQGQSQAPALAGVVQDTARHPIVHARVRVLGTEYATVTDQDGRYAFDTLPDGRYAVRAQFIGFLQSDDSVTIVRGTAARVEFRLRPSNCDIDCNPAVVPVAPKKPFN
jgi:hypothetical protein